MGALRRLFCGLMLVGAFFLLDSDASASSSGCENIGVPSECDCWGEGSDEFIYCDFWPEEGFDGAQICAQAGGYCEDNFYCFWNRFTVYGYCIAP